MNNQIFKNVVMAGLLAFSVTSTAEDIDLFVGAPPPNATDAPNVLILLDNTANWSSAFTNEIAALIATVNGLPVKADGTPLFRLGLMMFTETGGGNSGQDGGYVRAAVRPLTAANKTKYMALLNSLDKNGDKSNGGKLGNSMTDAYRYFKGQAPYSGNNKNKTDYLGNISGTTASNAIYALPGNALKTKAGSPYLSPVVSGCAKNFIIYISNGAAQDNSSDTTGATTQLSTAGGTTTAIPISPNGSQTNVGDEWARFMKKSSLNVTTYTVDIDKVATGQGPGWSALLKSMAGVSGGKYFDVSSTSGVNGAAISNALGQIFSEIQAVNSVFAAVSLPVSVNTQGTYLNQVFVGMFRPDQNAAPRWNGNLKQYKIGYNNIGNLSLLDADDIGAINSQTGFITECARSFWTPTVLDTYWSNKPQGSCLAVANSDISNYPDGNIVEKGAQGFKLRGSVSRTVKTCSATFSGCTALLDFNNSNVTQANLGAASTAERDALINWAKGLDVDDENVNGVTTLEMRQTAHGDVVHSRPVAINYGSDVSPSVVVFYGGNDGILRAVNGNRSTSIGAVAAGGELWSFVAPEFFKNIKRIRDNTVQISFKGSAIAGAQPKPYGFDGAITAHQSASTAWIFATMRRGGRALYSFDVSTPASPSLKWKRGCPNAADDVGCSSGFDGMGQSWSAPKVIKSTGYGGGSSPMLIMGGGYDPCEDGDPHTCTATSKGKQIYVMDADTGALLKTFNTERGVISEVTMITDDDGLVTYGYASDLGGNLYRISGATANTPIGATAPASWTMTKIAALGGSGTDARKFMFAPDVVVDNGVHVLLLGSGDREKPLTAYSTSITVANRFYMIKDIPTNLAWLSAESATCGGAFICHNSLTAITASVTPEQSVLDLSKGWYLGLSASEQVVTSSVTVFGTVTFSTHQPAAVVAGACSSNLGEARVYNVRYLNAASANGTSNRYEDISGDGLPPSPVAGKVTLDNGETVPFIIGASAKSPLEGSLREGGGGSVATSQPKSRVYWYIQQ